MITEPLTLDQFHAHLRARGYDVPRESPVLLDLYDLYQRGEWGEMVQSEFAALWVWNEKARHLLAPYALIQWPPRPAVDPGTEENLMDSLEGMASRAERIKQLEQQLETITAQFQAETAHARSIALREHRLYLEARALLQEALDEMKEWLWVNRERREQTMQAMRAFLAKGAD